MSARTDPRSLTRNGRPDSWGAGPAEHEFGPTDSGVCDIVARVWSLTVPGTRLRKTSGGGRWLVADGQWPVRVHRVLERRGSLTTDHSFRLGWTSLCPPEEVVGCGGLADAHSLACAVSGGSASSGKACAARNPQLRAHHEGDLLRGEGMGPWHPPLAKSRCLALFDDLAPAKMARHRETTSLKPRP
jgi:hypothetical protein